MGKKSEPSIIRFAVGSSEAQHSSVWRLWGQKENAYLAARTTGGFMKTSLHGTDWRVAITKEAHKEKDTDRILCRWARPKEFVPGWTRSIGILVPAVAVKKPFSAQHEGSKPVLWYPPIPISMKRLFSILFSSSRVDPDSWRLFAPSNAELVGRILLTNGETVSVISWEEMLSPEESTVVQEYIDKLKIHVRTPVAGMQAFLHSLSTVADEPPTLVDILLGEENLEIAAGNVL